MRPIACLIAGLLVSCAPEPQDVAEASEAAAAACESVTVPDLLGQISDHGAMLTEAEEDRLALRLARYEGASGHQTVIATIPALDGLSINSVATCIGNRWGIGNDERDDGVMILLTARERQARVALGLGLSDTDNDPRAAAVISAMAPHFAQGNLAAGLDSGIAVLERQLP